MSSNNPNSNSPAENDNNNSPHGNNPPSPGGHNDSNQSPSSINSNISTTGTVTLPPESPISTQPSAPLEGSLPNGIRITKKTIEGATWPADLILVLGKSNWLEWSCQLGLLVLQHGLTAWLEGTLACPDPLASPDTNNVWTHNDDALRGFIRDHISTADIEHVEFSGCTTAHDLFVTLRTQHENQGPYTQISLLLKVLDIRFVYNTPVRDTLAEIKSYFRRITAMGKIKDEDIFIAIFLHSISDRYGPLAHLRQTVQKLALHPNINFDMFAKIILDQAELNRRSRELGRPVPIQPTSAGLNSLQQGLQQLCPR
jgi:hypothetical protein